MNSFETPVTVATKVTILSCFTLIQPFQRLERIEAEVERKAAMRSIFLMYSCELQGRRKKQSRLPKAKADCVQLEPNA